MKFVRSAIESVESTQQLNPDTIVPEGTKEESSRGHN